MFNHEYFHKLSALAAIGQLSLEEDRELSEHLLECRSCQEIHRDYAYVIQHELPQADKIRWRIKSSMPATSSFPDLRDRFLARARAEGVEFSPQVQQQTRSAATSSVVTMLSWRPALVLPVLALFAILAISLYRTSHVPVQKVVAVDTRSGHLAIENELLQRQVANLNQTLHEKSEQAGLISNDKSVSDQELRRYQKQLADLTEHSAQLAAEIKQLKSENAALAEANDEHVSQLATLTNASKDYASVNQQKDSAINELRARNERLYRERGELLAAEVRLQSQLSKLNDELLEQSASLERERQLMAVTKDVRGLMGARNLHIIDVHDVDRRGTEAKAFGRVFYAEGQSLIFYAFDLPNGALSPAKYMFQAWGQQEAGGRAPRNLGTFEVDDHEQRRWVLKVNDPRLLAGIDSVFVTAESRGGTDGSHGRKLMYAYLAGQANHP
jgi:hypothetical protein